ncbi:hypothetical protein [Nocardia sp. NPDC049149]|uniref:hypothetical protein n=1 Tax=Nocardia sp. NPDC049149 TaxID=3364315 RepID=UPI0037136881
MDDIAAQLLRQLRMRLQNELMPPYGKAAASPIEHASKKLERIIGEIEDVDRQGSAGIRASGDPSTLRQLIVHRYIPAALKVRPEPEAALALRFALRKLSAEIGQELAAGNSSADIARRFRLTEDNVLEFAGIGKGIRHVAHKYNLPGDKALALADTRKLRLEVARRAVVDEMERMLGAEATWVSFLDRDRTLVRWARRPENPFPEFNRDARIICWDAILIAGVRAGSLSPADICKFYGGLDDLGRDRRMAWLKGLPQRLIQDPLPYPVAGLDPVKMQRYADELSVSPEDLAAELKVARGDVLLWNDNDHAALATGTMVDTSAGPSPEVLTFWPPPGEHNPDPDTGSWARVDKVKRSNLHELTDFIENPPPTTALGAKPVWTVWQGRGPFY